MRPTAVVMHAVRTINPKTTCPGHPMVICAASASRLAPSVYSWPPGITCPISPRPT